MSSFPPSFLYKHPVNLSMSVTVSVKFIILIFYNKKMTTTTIYVPLCWHLGLEPFHCPLKQEMTVEPFIRNPELQWNLNIIRPSFASYLSTFPSPRVSFIGMQPESTCSKNLVY